MSYNVTYTETNNPLKQPIVVNDETLNTQTSLTFVGKNYAGYGKYVANNFLHLLENFSSPTPPGNPVQGQVWYDNINHQLMINNDGTSSSWTSASSVQKSISKPTVANTGDLWVDTINQQLYIYKSGTAWTLVGPLLSQGTITGQQTETIIDTSGLKSHNVVSLYSSNNRIAIISSDDFIPQKEVTGFPKIQAGITISNLLNCKFNGTSTNTDSLGGYTSSIYPRTNIENTFTKNLNVKSIATGGDYKLTIGTDTATTTNYLISSEVADNSIEVRVRSSVNGSRTIAYFDPSQKVGIATTQPTATLDVNGSIKISSTTSTLTTLGTGNIPCTVDALFNINKAGSLLTASIQTKGGLYVEKSVLIGTNSPSTTTTKQNLFISNGTLVLDYLDVTGITPVPTAGSVILPGYQTHDLTSGTYVEKTTTPSYYDIGSPTHRFRNFYVKNFVGNVVGNLTGNVTGDVSGNVSGSAGSLNKSSDIKFNGDITSNTIAFNGDGSPLEFEVTISTDAISSKGELNDSSFEDELLVYRKYVAQASGYIDGTSLILGNIDYGANFIAAGLILSGADTNGNSILTGTTIVSGTGTSWVLDKTQTIGSSNTPIIIKFGSPRLYKTTKQTFIDDVSIVRVGSIILYPNNILPKGYVLCNGQAYKISDYADLYNVLGSSYLVTGDPTEFTVPTLAGPVSGLNYMIYTGVF